MDVQVPLKVLVLLCLFAHAARSETSANGTVADTISALPASSFVYNPIASNKLMTSLGGTSTPRQLAQWPTLQYFGISQTSFVMNGCALRPPHTHMRATGLLYVMQASNMSVGFVTEGGQSVINYVQTGASTIFPQGLVHYQQNNDCNPAYYTITYNSDDPGTQVVTPALEALPEAVVASSLGVSVGQAQGLVGSKPKAAFIPNSDPDCVARCQAAGINVLAPAPAVMPAVSNAGR